MSAPAEVSRVDVLADVTREMRERQVARHFKSQTLIDWADRIDEASAAVAELIEADRWIPFTEKLPPESHALDDDSVRTMDSVLVTNNIGALDRMGRMSHVWFLSPIKTREGEWVGYTEAHRKVHGLTHWRHAGTRARLTGEQA